MKLASLALLAICSFCSLTAFSQSENELAPGYYVIVGAYGRTKEAIAQHYVEELKRTGAEADYGFNSSRRMYFVYVQYEQTLKSALKKLSGVRKEDRFKNAWVRVVAGDVGKPEATASLQQKSNIPQNQPSNPVEQVNAVPSKTDPTIEETPTSPQIASSNDSVVVTENEEIKQYKKMTLGNTEVFLSLYQARNNRIVEGDINVIDTDRAKLITKVKGNEYLHLPDPNSKSGQLTLISEVFGYRKIQHDINYPVPLADTVKPFIDLMGTTIVVNFDLVRYYKGDKVILYNVYFYNDAAVMLPESKYELNSLLQMMQEEPYRIRLHGHTNGNYNGRIKTMGKDRNFFSLTGSVDALGSAKDLSRMRAEIIKDYLVANGIAGDRIEVKAWGGKKPLYDKHGANAKKNVRVEVEILQDKELSKK